MGHGDAYAGQIDLLADLTGLRSGMAARRRRLPVKSHGFRIPTSPGVARVHRREVERSASFGKVCRRKAVSPCTGSSISGRCSSPRSSPARSSIGNTRLRKSPWCSTPPAPSNSRSGKMWSLHNRPARSMKRGRKSRPSRARGSPITVSFERGSGDPALRASWFTAQSATPRPFPLRRVLLPYAKVVEEAPLPHHEDLRRSRAEIGSAERHCASTTDRRRASSLAIPCAARADTHWPPISPISSTATMTRCCATSANPVPRSIPNTSPTPASARTARN